MRKLEEVYIKYVGYQEPETEEELEMELLGLETALCAVKSRIAILHQSRHMKAMMEKASSNRAEPSNDKTVEETQTPDQAE